MATGVDYESQGCCDQTVLPHDPAQTTSKIKLTPKMKAVLTGHGMTKAYLHRFHLIDEARCSCGEEYQSVDQLLFHCPNLSAQRGIIKQQIGTWPASKEDLVSEYQKELVTLAMQQTFIVAIQRNG